MKALWTQIPLPKVTDIKVAEYYVARGWVDKIEDIYIELTDKQKAYRQSLSAKKIYIKDAQYKSVWTNLPVSRRIMMARDYYKTQTV
ncbi:MAG: hypothetical protein SFZ02_11515 [bacterium]|nr:hypothetical protein [bacterium]